MIGSIAGGLARYYVAGGVQHLTGGRFPFGTLAVNLLGCFVIGFIVSASAQKWTMGPSVRLFLVTGFCGAFTTFSALMLETDALLRSSHALWALGNIFMSVTAGFMVYRLGIFVGENVF